MLVLFNSNSPNSLSLLLGLHLGNEFHAIVVLDQVDPREWAVVDEAKSRVLEGLDDVCVHLVKLQQVDDFGLWHIRSRRRCRLVLGLVQFLKMK
jgi:hypothetical protein